MAFPDELNELIEQSMETFLSRSALLEIPLKKPELRACKDYYCGVIHIIGSWYGTISFEIPAPFIREIVKSLDVEHGTEAEPSILAEDLVCELTNMIGGNIKSSLGENCILSPPKCYLRSEPDFSEPESFLEAERFEQVFSCPTRLCLHIPVNPPKVESS